MSEEELELVIFDSYVDPDTGETKYIETDRCRLRARQNNPGWKGILDGTKQDVVLQPAGATPGEENTDTEGTL